MFNFMIYNATTSPLVAVAGANDLAVAIDTAIAYRNNYALTHCDSKPAIDIVNNATGEIVQSMPGETPLENADFSVRTYNTLKRYGINTIEELRRIPIGDFEKIRNFGAKCFCEVVQYLLAQRLNDPSCTVTFTRDSNTY